MDNLTILGETNFRGARKRFGITRADRLSHIYVIGKTGTGKSTFLENLIRQDLESGGGLALLDPHGDLVARVLAQVPDARRDHVTYFDVPNHERALGFNPLAGVRPERRALAASGLLDVFKKLWSDSWGPRLEYILRNALLALLDQPDSTLEGVLRLFSDDEYRRRVGQRTGSPQARDFWLREYPRYSERLRAEAIAPIQNKVGAFLSDPLLRDILTASRPRLDLRMIMDEGRVLLVNLAKGKIGSDTAALLGAMLVTSMTSAAFGRAELPEGWRRDFWVYLDEFHSFTTLSVATMLSELRKYGVGMVLAHQYLAQLEPEVRDAILGNVGTIVSFRLGYQDAELLAQEFFPEFSAADLVNLPNHEIYLRLMVNGTPSSPFSAKTIPPPNGTWPRETYRT